MNVSHYGGDVALVTVTAPGRDRLPDIVAMRRWNRGAPARWRRLHQRAREAALRDGHRVRLLSKTWEYQKRGALHVHVVVGVDSPRELAAAHAYVAQLARLRLQHDFGFVDRGRRTGGRRALEVVPAQRAARYVAKYLSPLDSTGKPTMSETVKREDVPPHVTYVDRRLTSETGCTMRSLRERRRMHCMGFDPDTGLVVDAERAARNGVIPLTEALARMLGSPPDL